MPDRVQYGYHLNDQPLSRGAWADLRLQSGFGKAITTAYPCVVEDPLAREITPDVVDDFGAGNFSLLYAWTGVAITVRLGNGNAHVNVAAETTEKCQAAIEKIKTILPEHEPEEEGRIPITFWSYTPHGPQQMNRDLDAPTWDGIRANYDAEAQAGLEALMSSDFKPGRGGQLILWHGQPGTGKTTALRALGQAWKHWAQIHYITDPERFFGEHSDYMLQVMVGAGDIKGDLDAENKWRLLVLEDAGELLQKDAKREVGAALGRFLNAVDGMIGQGLRVMTLVTTNEDLGALNEAVTRHGRAAAEIEFKTLTPAEGAAVLYTLRKPEEPGFTEEDAESLIEGRSMILADIYALAEGRTHKAEKPLVGFAGG